MTDIATPCRTPDRAACARSGPALGMAAPLAGSGPPVGGARRGLFTNPELPLVPDRLKGVSPHFRAQPLHFLALDLAALAGELDAGTLAAALGQDPAAPTASAFRTVARETLDRMTAAGLLTRRGRAPAFFWTLPT